MSVNSKMKAIADPIRSLLGISGDMGLDEMATNLVTEQINVVNAFASVGNKGGTVPDSKVSANLVAAIESIPTGVTVKKTSENFTTKNGRATIDLGFKPDIFFFTQNQLDDGHTMTGCLAFAECSNSKVNTTTWDKNDNIIDVYATRSATGVSLTMYTYADYVEWRDVEYNGTFKYVAVKYT